MATPRPGNDPLVWCHVSLVSFSPSRHFGYSVGGRGQSKAKPLAWSIAASEALRFEIGGGTKLAELWTSRRSPPLRRPFDKYLQASCAATLKDATRYPQRWRRRGHVASSGALRKPAWQPGQFLRATRLCSKTLMALACRAGSLILRQQRGPLKWQSGAAATPVAMKTLAEWSRGCRN